MNRIVASIIVAVMLLPFVQQSYSQSLDYGLVAYYPFNGNADDESGNGNHGTVYGATLTEDRFGITSSAYYFDGQSSYISVNHNEFIDLTMIGSFSGSAWFQTSVHNPSWNGIVLQKKRDVHPGYVL